MQKTPKINFKSVVMEEPDQSRRVCEADMLSHHLNGQKGFVNFANRKLIYLQNIKVEKKLFPFFT